jgi:multiple sugar transport system substrate-binding protein
MFYQKAMFDEAGLNYPPALYGEQYKLPDGTLVEWDFQTMAKIARYLTLDANGEPAMTYAEGNFTPNPRFDRTRVVQWGFVAQDEGAYDFGALWGAARVYTLDAGGKYVASLPDSWIAAWQYYYDGVWGALPFIPSAEITADPGFGAGKPFNSGNVAMAIAPSASICCIAGAGTSWDLAALPAHDGAVTGRVGVDSFRIPKGSRDPAKAFAALTYLAGTAAPKLVAAYGGMPARNAGQPGYLAAQARQFPFVSHWDAIKGGLAFADNPSAEGYMPDYQQATATLDRFWTLLQSDGKLNLKAEIARLQADLQAIFNQGNRQ